MALFHLTMVFAIPGPKEATFGLDFDSPGGLVEADLDAINAGAINKWNTGANPLAPRFSPSIALVRASSFVFEMTAQPGEEPPFRKQLTLGPRVQSANVPGTGSGDPVAPQVALVCSLKTAISTRRTRGRIYLPPPLKGEVANDGRVSASVADAFEAGVQSFVESVEGIPVGFDYSHVIVSQQGASIITPVTSYVVKRRVDTQRRRLSRTIDNPT